VNPAAAVVGDALAAVGATEAAGAAGPPEHPSTDSITVTDCMATAAIRRPLIAVPRQLACIK
jgi:hypothetical protein